jgi:lipoyl(octanoyl) transferase
MQSCRTVYEFRSADYNEPMSVIPKTRLLIEDVGSSGSWNMAVDEFLLCRALTANELAIRVYRWNTPTVSLGYFQDSTEFFASGQFPSLPVVRRLSGGGAILHDREITYSIAVPATHSLIVDPVQLYEAAHSGIVRVFQELGVALDRRGTNLKRKDEPFLCFSRGDRNDLVLQGVKVVGSAQRRRKGAVLQHGSILLDASPHAEHLPGIRNLTRDFQPHSTLEMRIGQELYREIARDDPEANSASILDAEMIPPENAFPDDERLEIRAIEDSNYRHVDQMRNRSAGQSSL